MVDSLQCIDNVNSEPTWSYPRGLLHLQWQMDVGSVPFGMELEKITWRIVSFSRRLMEQIAGKITSLSFQLARTQLILQTRGGPPL